MAGATVVTTGAAFLAASLAAFAVPADVVGRERAEERVRMALDPVRPRWPIVREASGRFVVVGEARTRPFRWGRVRVTLVKLKVEDADGSVLATQVFEGPRVNEALAVLAYDATGAPVVKEGPVLEPGDIGIAALGLLAGAETRPRTAEVTFGFAGGRTVRAVVPLDVFRPGQPMAWPLGFESGLHWTAENTFSPADPIPPHRLGLFPAPSEFFFSQRFAIDAVERDGRGETSVAPSSGRKEDYHAWDKEIRSTGAGDVVAVVSDQPDVEIGSADPAHPAGNYVVVRHRPRLFSVYAHMRQGSAAVAVGEAVEAGGLLGRVGNSGNTSEPHLHFHFADRWDGLDPVLSFYTSQGLPAVFSNAHVQRGALIFPLEGATVLGGDVVEP
jgi:hypothetical protein